MDFEGWILGVAASTSMETDSGHVAVLQAIPFHRRRMPAPAYFADAVKARDERRGTSSCGLEDAEMGLFALAELEDYGHSTSFVHGTRELGRP